MPEEKNEILKYRIDLEKSGITEEKALQLVKQAIEEAKLMNPEKAEDLGNIEIKDTKIRESLHKLSVGEGSITLAMIFCVILGPIIVDTWKEVVIPLIQKNWE